MLTGQRICGLPISPLLELHPHATVPYCFCFYCRLQVLCLQGKRLTDWAIGLAPWGNSKSQCPQEGLVRSLWEHDVCGRGTCTCEHGVLGGPGSLAPVVAVSTIVTWIPTGAITNWEQMTHLWAAFLEVSLSTLQLRKCLIRSSKKILTLH